MRLNILPGSLWVAYVLTAPKLAGLIPPNTKLAKVKLLKDDSEEYRLLFNIYEVRAPFMCGSRIDIQTVVKDKNTNTHHLVILDVLSTTMDWNPKSGILAPNSKVVMHDSSISFCRGEDYMNITVLKEKNDLPPDYVFAVEANRKCYYSDHPMGYQMKFDEASILRDVTLLEGDVKTNIYNKWRTSEHTHLFRHNHAMIFDVIIPWSTFRTR